MASSLIRLKGVDAKIVRAKVHIETLKADVLAYLKTPDLVAFPSKLNREARTAGVFFTLSADPPIPLSIVAGDVVHNARSSLDHLWAALTRSGDSGFPCWCDATKWQADRAKVLCRVPANAQAFIDSLQPCAGTNDGKLLGILNLLSNRDKHKIINLTATNTRNCRLKLYSRTNPHHSIQFPMIDALDTDTPIKITDLTDDVMEGGMEVNMAGRLVVALKDAPLKGESMIDLLDAIIDAIESRIVPTLRAFVR